MSNVPPLRFPGFSEEWERKRFRDVCNITTGNKNTQDKSDDGIYPFYVRSQIVERINSWTFDGEAILTAGDGVGVGKVFHYSTGKIGVHQRVYILSDFKCDGKYLYSYFAGHFYNRVKRMSAKNSVDSVRMEMIADMPISLPSTEEQKKIGHLLALLDERIATQNKIIEDLKKLKSAISKQAFAQKPNGWNRLDTLFSKGKAGGTPTSTNKEYYNGEIPFLSINDITKQGKYVRYTENHLSRSGLENSSAWVVPEYSLIISMYASVGLVTINEVPITTSQAMFAMQLRDKDLLDYLYYYLSYFKYRHIHKFLETGTQSNINADTVRGIMIPTYGHSRNMKIASTLQSIDAKIDNELSVLKLFNRQKNYHLSQMFI